MISNNMLIKNSDLNISFEEEIIRMSYVVKGMNKGLVIKKKVLTEDTIKALLLFGSSLYADGVIYGSEE